MVGTREQRTREVLTFAAEDAFNVSAPTSVQRVATSNAVLKDEIEQNKQVIFCHNAEFLVYLVAGTR